MTPSPRTYVLRTPGANRGRLVQVHQHREGFIVSDANACTFDENGSVLAQTTVGTIDTPLPYEDAIQRAEELVAQYTSMGAELVETTDHPPVEYGPVQEGNGDIYLYTGVEITLPTFKNSTRWGDR